MFNVYKVTQFTQQAACMGCFPETGLHLTLPSVFNTVHCYPRGHSPFNVLLRAEDQLHNNFYVQSLAQGRRGLLASGHTVQQILQVSL